MANITKIDNESVSIDRVSTYQEVRTKKELLDMKANLEKDLAEINAALDLLK